MKGKRKPKCHGQGTHRQLENHSHENEHSNNAECTKEATDGIFVKDVIQRTLHECEDSKIGVILCEGTEDSIDKAVYSAVFPDFVIIPLGSCCTVSKFLYRVRKKLAVYGLYAFGIIDRDALTKREIKKLKEEKCLYTTKLPFIENIICMPEVIEYLCEVKKLDYGRIIYRIEDELIRTLWRQLKESLPINIGLPKEEKIETVSVRVATKQNKAEKIVDRASILYAYRDKIIVTIVGSAFGSPYKKEYYEEIKLLLQQEEHRSRLVKIMMNYLPKLEEYDLEEF